jgi:hypothetical protein
MFEFVLATGQVAADFVQGIGVGHVIEHHGTKWIQQVWIPSHAFRPDVLLRVWQTQPEERDEAVN